jgi:hypothetical protein
MKRSQPLNTIVTLLIHLFYEHADDNNKGSPEAEQIIRKGKVKDLKKRPVKKENSEEKEEKP